MLTSMTGSFFAFDLAIPGSSRFTVLSRSDPFPRMLISMDPLPFSSEWTRSFSFYALTIPLRGMTQYFVKSVVPSLVNDKNDRSHVSRHKLTPSNFEKGWDFVMGLYVFPASPEDCSDLIPR